MTGSVTRYKKRTKVNVGWLKASISYFRFMYMSQMEKCVEKSNLMRHSPYILQHYSPPDSLNWSIGDSQGRLTDWILHFHQKNHQAKFITAFCVFWINYSSTKVNSEWTRMLSSRMRTVRNSSRLLGGVPVPRGCTWSRGCTCPGGIPGPGGCTWSQGVPAQVLPPVDRQTGVKT